MTEPLKPEHVQGLVWATLDDQTNAFNDAQKHGVSYAKIVFIQGDVRLKRIDPRRVKR